MSVEYLKRLRIVPKTTVTGSDLLQPFFNDSVDPIDVIKKTPFNRTLMMFEGIFRRDLILIHAAFDKGEGVCLSDYNAYAISSSDPLVRLHEEAHLRLHRVYPYKEGLFTDVLAVDIENNNSKAFQKDFVEKAIDEGAADFVMIEAVIKRSKEPLLRTAAERHNKLLYNSKQGGTNSDYQKWMGCIFGLNEKTVQTYETLLVGQNPLKVLGGLRSLVKLVDALSYSTGYNYVAHGMNVLRTSSIPDPEALRMIMNQQPVTVAELTDPVGFIQTLVSH